MRRNLSLPEVVVCDEPKRWVMRLSFHPARRFSLVTRFLNSKSKQVDMKKSYSLPFAFLLTTIGCGGSGGSDSSSIAGSWVGEVEVKVSAGDPACEFFAGLYPISWRITPSSPSEFTVFDGEFAIGTAVAANSSSAATSEFNDVENHPPELSVHCLGNETVTMTLLSDSQLEWNYQGTAQCGTLDSCVYGGSGVLSRQ